MNRIKNIIYKGKKTKNKQTGQQKQFETIIGALFKRQDGSVVIKINSIPVDFNGWCEFEDI